MKILSLLTHPHIIPKLKDFGYSLKSLQLSAFVWTGLNTAELGRPYYESNFVDLKPGCRELEGKFNYKDCFDKLKRYAEKPKVLLTLRATLTQPSRFYELAIKNLTECNSFLDLDFNAL